MICFSVLLYVHNQFVYYIAIFLIGFSVPLKAMIAYTHLMEFLPGRVSTVSGVILFNDCFIMVTSPLILQYVTKDTDFMLYVGLVINIVGIIVFAVVYIPESVKYLLDKGRFEEARKNITYIYKFNRSNQGQILICDSLFDRLVKRKTSKLELLLAQNKQEPKLSIMQKLRSEKNLIHNLTMMMLAWISGGFIFFLLNFLIKYMPGDIYFNSIVSGLSAVVLLVQGNLNAILDLKGGQAASFVLALGASISLCFFDADTDKLLLYAIVLLLAKAGASLSIGFAFAIH